MNLKGEAKKLKVIVGEHDMIYRRPLYEAILFSAKKYQVAGATLWKGIMSFGANSIDNHTKVFALSGEKPVIIEIIDNEERINDFSEIAKDLIMQSGAGGIIFIEDANVVLYTNADIHNQ